MGSVDIGKNKMFNLPTLFEDHAHQILYCTVLYCTVLYCPTKSKPRPASQPSPSLNHKYCVYCCETVDKTCFIMQKHRKTEKSVWEMGK